MDFKKNYQTLNPAQKQAVDTIEGPVLVIAGPGTGKTQLLSLRVANILDKTDTLPQNILCLTFTESGALNMRERLTRFIKKAAYDVRIATYHTFGSELIQQFADYMHETNLERPIDDLGKYRIIETIINKLSYLSPLKQTRHHLGDVLSTISEVKRALLTADDLRLIVAENQAFLHQSQPFVSQQLETLSRMPSKLPAALAFFEPLVALFEGYVPKKPLRPPFASLAQLAHDSLTDALKNAQASNKTTPLTAWKNKWLAKNNQNQFCLNGELENRRIMALADVITAYQTALAAEGLYDFDDMILRAIQVLEANPELRFTLQERYLYIMLDEFQDTNAAQLKLVRLLTDNPVHEGRPNILAVGDDDQAIYAFQGAEYSNMLDFYHLYREVVVVNLTQNYRSHGDILQVAHNIAKQIEARLHHSFTDMSKTLTAANPQLAHAHIARHEFLSDIAEADWIAGKIKNLIQTGTKPSDIAILAPKHKYLEPLVPYLNAHDIAVRYEKRENILETPVVNQLVYMSQLIIALQQQDEPTANHLWPRVLSYDFWQLPTSIIWQLSWQLKKSSFSQAPNWSQAMLQHEQLRPIALFFLALAHKTVQEPLETMLDYLIGTATVATHEPNEGAVTSPLKAFYTTHDKDTFYHTLSHLNVLRAKLREHQAAQTHTLHLGDLVQFIELYNATGQQLINTSPYAQAATAVQLMTVFKAKGLEFTHVFLPHCSDEVWGESSRGQTNKLTLPPNLLPIRHAGATPDERLRQFFVAVTRAKIGLHLSSHVQNYAGKQAKRLKYLDEQEQADGSFKAAILPAGAQLVRRVAHEATSQQAIELSWHTKHLMRLSDEQFKELIRQERLTMFKLSPTHLNQFIDLEHCGPQDFYLFTLLGFPKAATSDLHFGNAIHETLEWVQNQLNRSQSLPPIATIHTQFQQRLAQKPLMLSEQQQLLERGQHALRAYFDSQAHYFKIGDQAEMNFMHEDIMLGEARLSGKVDKICIDKATKTITVVDYKTGISPTRWDSSLRLHKYKQQLYCYKLLIEQSARFRGYTVEKGILAFIEPDQNGTINQLELTFADDELMRIRQLLQAVWRRIQMLDFPDTSQFSPTITGVKAFENWLLKNN